MPGQPNGMYHRERGQEGFLLVAGECILVIEGEERRLKAWDFVHCPSWTHHVFVGAGEGPCVIVMTGSRKMVEVQGTAEQHPFDDDQLAKMLALAKAGIDQLILKQRAVLGTTVLSQ